MRKPGNQEFHPPDFLASLLIRSDFVFSLFRAFAFSSGLSDSRNTPDYGRSGAATVSGQTRGFPVPTWNWKLIRKTG
jgi:hypothetical protein